MRKYRNLIIIASVVVIIVVYYVICSMMAVGRYTDQFNDAYWSGVEEAAKKESVEMKKVPGYQEALHDRGLLKAQVQMAANDSIGLFLNLPDSVAKMMIKGVSVRDIKIEEIQLSPFFRRADQEAIYDLLSEPMRITFSTATIAQEPLNEVQAPKDSKAADSIPMITPDTSNSQPVFFILNTDKNVRFYVYQTERDNFSDIKAAWNFAIDDRWAEAKKTAGAIFSFRVPEYMPTIKIGINKVDAKVLYRAIPPHGQILLTK